MRYLCVLTVLIVVASSRTAAAEIVVASTLEWLADHCIDSGIYRATRITKVADPTDGHRVAFARQEMLRGDPTESVNELYYRPKLRPGEDRTIVEVGDEFLICFQHYGTGEKRAVQLINLSNPQDIGASFIAVTSQVRILREGAVILKVFRNRLKDRPEGDPVEVGDHSRDNRFELAPGMEPYKAIYAGSSCYLRIPADLRAQVAEQVPSAHPPPDKALQLVRARPTAIELSGVLRRPLKWTPHLELVPAGQTKRIDLKGDLLNDIQDGTPICVRGVVRSHLHPGSTEDNLSPIAPQWLVWLEVTELRVLDDPLDILRDSG
ncbi:MAG: hypothetical protein V3R72_11040 [Gammaproteobacteria bacterium]